MWRCPKCAREFQRNNQWHSCGSSSVEDHLKGKPAVIGEVYNLLEEGLRRSGVRIDPAKTAINLWRGRNYATIYLQERGIKLEFLSRTVIQDNRIIKQRKVRDGLYFNMLKLARKEDVDDKIIEWLKGID